MSPRKIRRYLRKKPVPAKFLFDCSTSDNVLFQLLPLFESLKQQLPECRIYIIIASENGFLISLLPVISGFFSVSSGKKKRNDLVAELKAYSFDILWLPYANARLAFSLRKAGIGFRFASVFKDALLLRAMYFSWMRKKTNRSYYSLMLPFLRHLGLRSDYRRPTIRNWLKPAKTGRYVLLDSGSLSASGMKFPQAFLEPLEEVCRKRKRKVIFDSKEDPTEKPEGGGVELQGRVGRLRRICEQISAAELVISADYTVLQLASLFDIPHIGLFPENRRENFRLNRSYPLTQAHAEMSLMIGPALDFGCFVCLGRKCRHYPCLDLIDLDKITAFLKSNLPLKPKTTGFKKKRA